MSEAALLKRIMLNCGRGAMRLFRNNCGAYQDKRGIWVRYGVASPGGSDLIGWTVIEVTPEMAGKRIAVFTALECKHGGGKLTDEQRHFIRAVQDAGGIAAEVRTIEDVDKATGEAVKKLNG